MLKGAFKLASIGGLATLLFLGVGAFAAPAAAS